MAARVPVAAQARTYIMAATRTLDLNRTSPKPMSDKASLMQQTAPLTAVGLQRELAALFVKALNLEVQPEDIDPDAPLYGDGLGLDSIDILEVALIVSKQYGIHLRADSRENQQIFRSLRHLAEFIAAQRTR